MIRAFGFGALGCLGLVLLGYVGTVALITEPSKPTFDESHPDYVTFAAVFAQADRAFDGGQNYVVIDLAPLNAGSWRTACLFAGYTHPIQQMERLGAKIDQADRDRLGEPLSFRAAPVEESELVIAFTEEERAQFIHFRQGMGQHTQRYWECVTKPETKLAVSEASIPGRTTPLPQGE